MEVVLPYATFLCSSRMYKTTIQATKTAAPIKINNIRQCTMTSVASAENIDPMITIPMMATMPITIIRP